MTNLITLIWNIRHCRLLKETTCLVRLQLFLRHKVGLTSDWPVRDLKKALKSLENSRKRG